MKRLYYMWIVLAHINKIIIKCFMAKGCISKPNNISLNTTISHINVT